LIPQAVLESRLGYNPDIQGNRCDRTLAGLAARAVGGDRLALEEVMKGREAGSARRAIHLGLRRGFVRFTGFGGSGQNNKQLGPGAIDAR
jgi:hypothetical protein